MKKLIAFAALATAAISTPALASSVTGEVRLGDVRGGKADSTEYRVEAWDSLYGVKIGAELQAKQAANAGALKGLVSAKAGLEGPAIAGVHSLAYVEVGHALTQKVGAAGGNHEFWGAGVKFKRDLIGPVALTAGYRHREGFDAADRMNEERLHAGLALNVNEKTALGATYYRTRGTNDSDAVGLGITRKF
jgi:hypothetical protein